jgi:hypothetical protein
MGWCHEFGPDINADCGHPMVADAKSCKCTTCGVVCTGRFSGCAAVWAAGPRKVNAVRGSLAQRRLTPVPVDAAVQAPDAPEAQPAPANDAQVDALRAELASVMRRLDDVQVEAVRTDLASVVRQLDALTSAVAAQRQELQRLAQPPAPSPSRPARPAEQAPPRSPQADRGPQAPSQPRRPEPARPNGGPSAPPRPAPTAVPPASTNTPAPGEPEQVDLAVPLDQALLRPATPEPRQG